MHKSTTLNRVYIIHIKEKGSATSWIPHAVFADFISAKKMVRMLKHDGWTGHMKIVKYKKGQKNWHRWMLYCMYTPSNKLRVFY